ncbi:MAG: ABC transporter ATP-binding protein [Comamonas sp.]
MTNAKLSIAGLAKRYGSFVALHPTDLQVAEGEFLTLLGPSGSGKTTLLSMIAGLAVPDEGQLLINGQDVTYGAPYERDIGMVFQNYALFPHMTIAENIAFPLKMRKLDRATAMQRAQQALELVHLPHVAGRFPKELSGGQQQRIALARCLVYKPSIVLMDEPLGALDKKLREHMQLEIKRIHRESGTTIVYVTHDQEEAMTMSDRICLMNGGRIEQLGTPGDLYFRPRTPFVADFLGESNLLQGAVVQAADGQAEIALAGSGTAIRASAHQPLPAGTAVRVMVRPQNIALGSALGDAQQSFTGQVMDTMITGGLTKLYLSAAQLGSAPIVLSFPTSVNTPSFRLGSSVAFGWASADAVAVPEQP